MVKMVYMPRCYRLTRVMWCQQPLFRSYHQVASRLTARHFPSINTQPNRTHFMDTRDKDMQKREKQLSMSHAEIFERLAAQKAKDKATFQKAVMLYLRHQGVQRRGVVEFIEASLLKMKEFGVQKDLTVYKQIIKLFPQGKMIADTVWLKEMQHYPKQQQCMIDILDRMEFYGVIPDDETGELIIKIFGSDTHPMRKYQRMMYWMPKFKYANPYYVPHVLPEDPLVLAKMALKRMAVDLENKIEVFQSADYDDANDTFIVSAQSPTQRALIASHPPDVPLYVEGAFLTWLRDVPLMYFVLRGDTTKRYKLYDKDFEKQNAENFMRLDNIASMFDGPQADLIEKPSVHEQAEGTILGMTITGTGNKDSLAVWMKALQDSNPKLAHIPIVFLLRSPSSDIQVVKDEKAKVVLTEVDTPN